MNMHGQAQVGPWRGTRQLYKWGTKFSMACRNLPVLTVVFYTLS